MLKRPYKFPMITLQPNISIRNSKGSIIIILKEDFYNKDSKEIAMSIIKQFL